MTSKRLLTEESLQAIVLSNQSAPEDLAIRLRTVGSRVRKSVTEGYTTPPSFSKFHSTGNIFRSANDTLREIFNPMNPTIPIVAPNKRTRTQSDQGYNSDDAAEEDEDSERIDVSTTDTNDSARPIRALRKPRRPMLLTRSLPNGSLGLGGERFIIDTGMKEVEEEDWSMLADPSNQSFASPCKPLVIS